MSRRNASRRSSSAGRPAWVWFVLGNFVGGFAVFMVFMNSLQQEGVKARSVAGVEAPAKAEDKAGPKFDFYTLLQENEVSVPEPKTRQLERRASSQAGTSEEEAAPQPVAVESPTVFILQAASFREAAEADRLRAQLVLANLDVSVEQATDARGTWHRVLVGPYTSRSSVAKARQILAEHSLMPLVLKRPAKR